MPVPPVIITKVGPPKLNIPSISINKEDCNKLVSIPATFLSILKEIGYPGSVFKRVNVTFYNNSVV